eukprot:TRINITY_DN31_c0_g1_i1.p1 TRINITY_DN31_c0_g1~~TRINITY_DN31_c0_g1_i1.p1  ORF type:complete len:127 (+),score=57.02 TRINITY_DN31_c0_g1_i1:261-641(+)
MKTHSTVTSDRNKQRKAHFTAPSHERRKRMASALSKELREKHSVRALPIRKDDEVTIRCGSNKGKSGKVVEVYRKKYCVYIEGLSKDKKNGTPFKIPFNASNLTITKIAEDKNRTDLIARKAAGRV